MELQESLHGFDPEIHFNFYPKNKSKHGRPRSKLAPAVVSTQKASDSITSTLSEGNGDKLRYISKFLVQYVPDACPQNKETAVRISGARVLSNDKCVAILKDRKEKQKQHQREKERKD